MRGLKGRVAIVTGAGSGIGLAITRLFVEEGVRVVGGDVVDSHLEELKRIHEVTTVRADVTVQSDVDAMVAAALGLGRLDIVCNNAGILDRFLPVGEVTDDVWERVLAVNLTGPMRLSRAALPHMLRAKQGVILNVASIGGFAGGRAGAAYTASKGGLWALTKAMAADYLVEKIRVNCVCPGTTATPSLERRIQAFADPEKARADFIARQPMGRLGTDEEIAAAILFAASDEAAFLNGATISIDGGMTI